MSEIDVFTKVEVFDDDVDLERYPFLFRDDEHSFSWYDFVPQGWKPLFIEMCEKIKDLVNDEFEILEVKEKYGMLNVYAFNCNEKVYNIIHDYELKSELICIDCGKPAKYYTTGWISPYCEDCIKKQKEKYKEI